MIKIKRKKLNQVQKKKCQKKGKGINKKLLLLMRIINLRIKRNISNKINNQRYYNNNNNNNSKMKH